MPFLKHTGPEPLPMDYRILSAALELFVKLGYHNVSVHDIQKKADVSIGSIYKHFGGKEGIAKALYDLLLQEFNQMVDSVMVEQISSIAKCNRIIELLFEYTETRRDIIAFVLYSKHTEFIADKPAICSAEPFQKIRNMIQQGMDRGEIKSYDCWIASSVIIGGALRLIHLRLDGLIDQPLPELYHQLVEATWSSMEIQDRADLPKLVSNK